MFPLNSLSVSLSRKLDFPDPASPAKTRRYIGAGSSDSSMSSSEGWENETEGNRLKRILGGNSPSFYNKENIKHLAER